MRLFPVSLSFATRQDYDETARRGSCQSTHTTPDPSDAGKRLGRQHESFRFQGRSALIWGFRSVPFSA